MAFSQPTKFVLILRKVGNKLLQDTLMAFVIVVDYPCRLFDAQIIPMRVDGR